MSIRSQREQGQRSPADGREMLSGDIAWHTFAATEAAETLRGETARGLTEAEASRRLARSGTNRLAEPRGRSALVILLAQFQNLIILLLLPAAAIAFSLGENVEVVAILTVMVLNAAIGFLTGWNAGKALAALRKQTVPVAHVARDGVERQVAAAELVPVDLVILSAGARLPADGRVTEAARLQVEEAALTGEPRPVGKRPELVSDPEAALGDRSCMALIGTTVTDGRGRLLVTTTGVRTEVGKVGVMIEEAGTRETPLARKSPRSGYCWSYVTSGPKEAI
jgi:P-type Ca2+ transporter type 2C